MNEDLKRNAFYEEPWYDLKRMSEGCRECAYRADETHCRLYCRFLDAQGQCRCFHKEGEPFVSRKIEREMSDIEKRLLRAETPDFKEVRMIWLNNIWLIEDPLLYNVHDMGNVFGFEFHETEIFLLKHMTACGGWPLWALKRLKPRTGCVSLAMIGSGSAGLILNGCRRWQSVFSAACLY